MQENFTVGWGTLTLINAAIAQSKNRSAATWLVASIFLGPVATALLVLLPKYEATPEGLEREKNVEKTLKVVNVVLVVLVALVILVALGRKLWA
jgi:formate hydrogenlyase subunit 3/multisubunit Na+/H+ antiporter MnhD subunit